MVLDPSGGVIGRLATAAAGLGRKERLKHAGDDLRRHAGSGVLHRHHRVLANRQVVVRARRLRDVRL